MSEPEDLILEGAHFATRVARDAWRRYGPTRRSAEIALVDERRRLELFLAALFMRSIPIAQAEPPAPATWLARLARRPTPPAGQPAMPGTDGSRIFLPESLPVRQSEDDTRELYRLIAVEQAARLVAGFASRVGALERESEREWYSIRHSVSADRWIASQVPGLLPRLRRVRAEALAARPNDRFNSQNPIEQVIRIVLSSDPSEGGIDEPGSLDKLRWRPVHPVWYWGQVLGASCIPNLGAVDASGDADANRPPRVADMRRRPRFRGPDEDEDDRGSGTWVIRPDEPQESVEDAHGLQRPADRDDNVDPEGLGDSLSDLQEARIVRTPGKPREVLRSGDEIPKAARGASKAPPPRGIVYPEWDYRAGEYRLAGAVVREPPASIGDAGWISAALARHQRLVHRVRHRFERMQPRRVRLDRQPDGSEIDLNAFVAAAADLRAGTSVDERLYVADRRARRDLAVGLLVDVSASTDAWVSGNRRIVDVEKEALLIVCEALDALGDRYAIFAFSGHGPQSVCVVPIKRFDDRAGVIVRRRIAALDSDRYTRMGAAVRHVTVPLCRERAARRLLLIVSDGKPNDEDMYEGQYGVEDTRQAVAEARRQGIAVFCLTVDRAAPRYAARLFGRSGYAVVRRTEDLPVVIVDVLRQLVRQ